jgi:hypothetical protein
MSATAVDTQRNPIGRPRIGGKVQARVRDEICEAVKKEAERRGVPEADVVREMMEAGFRVWRPRGAR